MPDYPPKVGFANIVENLLAEDDLASIMFEGPPRFAAFCVWNVI